MTKNLRWLNKPRFFIVLLMAFTAVLVHSRVNAQSESQHLVKGVVKDENGESLPGVSIVLMGTTRGTVTDLDGAYSLSIPDATGQTVTLQATFVGYQRATQQVKADAGGTTTLDIAMKQDFLSLDEVVVTGTSVATSKRQLGNAISTVQVFKLPGQRCHLYRSAAHR